MADSDDEYERRKARDKFRRERNDYDRRDDRRRDPRDQWDHDRSSGRSRDVWGGRSRDRSGRDPYGRDYDSRRRERDYSPPPQRHVSPPHAKRMRRDWDDGGGYPHYDMPYSGGGGGGGHMHRGGHHGGPNWGPGPEMSNIQHQPQEGGPFNNQQGQRIEVDYPTQPPMLTFKQFLSQQDDSISDQDAIKKYNEYKLDFKKQQVNEFFLAHKEEEWFKFKYHPEDSGKRKEDINAALKRRCQVFIDLLEQSRIDNVSLDVEKDEEIVKVLDAAVIKMEGGTDFDLQVLDEPEVEEGSRKNSECQPQDKSPLDQGKKRKREESVSAKSDKAIDQPLKINISGEQKELMKKAKEFSKQQLNAGEEATSEPLPMDEKSEEPKDAPKAVSKKKNIRGKSNYNYESGSGSESGSESDSDSESEPAPPGVENDLHPPGVDVSGDSVADPEILRSAETSAEPKEEKEEKDAEEKEVDTTEKQEEDNEKNEEIDDEKEEELKPRALHKTVSIFLRNLAPSITKQEVEAMCKKYPGFMRVALQDPQPERRFFRRGWVTFERNSNIKNICWDLNNIRLRDCELGATLNRELKLRVRPVNGLTCHKQVVRQDIRIAAKVIKSLDEKWKMWDEQEGEEKKDIEKEPYYMLVSKNPVLKNITDYLVEEGSFEEEELLGQSAEEGERDSNPEFTVDRDENMLKALDRMILYLRIVHSVDYYSANEYPNEDEMPHRCGIMHARGVVPPGKVTQSDVNEWMTNFETKTKHLVEVNDQLNGEEALKLGKKDPDTYPFRFSLFILDCDTEVEKFVTSNTQELAKDKWLCPLSGKKFKGPEFVRKHLFSKHSEKVEEVKTEVSFFNNYLVDPKRPSLPEHPGNKQQGGPGGPGPGPQAGFHGPMQPMGYNQPRPPMMYGGGGPPSYNAPYGGGRDNYRGDHYRRGNYSHRGFRRRPDPRGIIEYRDLDAPEDVDIF
ncbi:hypothetical protein ScPMuIL_007830 [Solemya velum]